MKKHKVYLDGFKDGVKKGRVEGRKKLVEVIKMFDLFDCTHPDCPQHSKLKESNK